MRTLTKFTVFATLFAVILSCSVHEDEVNTIDSVHSKYSKEKDSYLVDLTEKYFNEIDDNINREQDHKFIEEKTNELLLEYSKVLEEDGGIEEVENALKTLEKSYKTANQSKQEDPCQVGFRKCAISVLWDLVQHVVGGGDESTGIISAYVGILNCVGDYIDCAFN